MKQPSPHEQPRNPYEGSTAALLGHSSIYEKHADYDFVYKDLGKVLCKSGKQSCCWAKVCKSDQPCRSRVLLSDEYFLANIGFNTAENEVSNLCWYRRVICILRLLTIWKNAFS